MSDTFPITNGSKEGDVLSPLLLNFALEYTIKRVRVNQYGLKLKGTHKLLVYADEFNIVGGRVHTIKKNTEALVVTNKETRLEENADKTKKWSCLEIRMQEEVIISRLTMDPLKGWNTSNVWEQP